MRILTKGAEARKTYDNKNNIDNYINNDGINNLIIYYRIIILQIYEYYYN